VAAAISLRAGAAALVALAAAAVTAPAAAAELPADRAEWMYHSYDGAGRRVDGPSTLLRMRIGERVSFNGTYLVEDIRDASPDLVGTASPAREKRREEGVGVDILARDALVSLAGARSREPDYSGNSFSVHVAQAVFGGMTTIRLGYARGLDDVFRLGNPNPIDTASRLRMRLGVTQVLSTRLEMTADVEALSDLGLLGSPYRLARVLGTPEPERLPRTRVGRAFAVGATASLGSTRAAYGSYRLAYDSWDLRAHTLELGLRQRLGARWSVEGGLRLYRQDGASFYYDNAPAGTEHVSRNRQLATFHSIAPAVRVNVLAGRPTADSIITVRGAWERSRTDYDDFTDAAGRPYAFDANLLQLSVAITF
jgi:hypothetical protein